MSKIVIYAEKPDVAFKIATAFGGVSITSYGKSINVDIDSYEKHKSIISRTYSEKGYVPFSHNGNEVKVTWGTGHMCGLKQAEDYNSDYKSWSKIPKPFFPEKYEIKIREGYNWKTKKRLKVDPSAKKQLDIIKKLFNESDYIINATDDDREGELIFAYVYEYVKSKKPYKRVFLDSYTEEGIKKAFTKLKDMTEVKNIEMAGRGRAIADFMVGANLTVAATLNFSKAISSGKKNDFVVSIGRVQTPTTNILVERENEIRNFKPSTTFYLQGEFTTKDGRALKYKGSANKTEYETEEKATEHLKDLQKKPADVIMYNRKDNYKEAPLLYSLSALSIDANTRYGMTAKATLDTAQSLYTKGFLTYPRTSSSYLPEDMKETINSVLDELGKMPEFEKYVKAVPKGSRRMTKRHFNDAKVESHYAIVPTNKTPNLASLTNEEKNIYTLVAQSVIKSVYPPAHIQSTKIETQVGEDVFYTSGNVTVDESWMALEPSSSRENELPILKVGDSVDHDLSVNSKTTRAPNRYTDSSLIAAMLTAGKKIENSELRAYMSVNGDGGIGTEATRAGIIETVISRGYAKRQGNYIVPTEKGMKLIEHFPIQDIKSPELTAKWESRLTKIQKGEDALKNFIADLEKQTSIWTKEVMKTNMDDSKGKIGPKETEVLCPNCGSPIIENDFGFFCSGNERDNPYSCQFKLWKASQKVKFTPDVNLADLKLIVEGKASSVKNAVSKTGNAFQFYMLLDDDKQSINRAYPESKNSTKVSDTSFVCPVCGNNLKHIFNEEKGYDFYSCQGHVIVGADYFGTPFSEDNIRKLLEGEVIGPLTLKYKDTEYEGYLHLDPVDGKVKKYKE